jgi:hypothetical protein
MKKNGGEKSHATVPLNYTEKKAREVATGNVYCLIEDIVRGKDKERKKKVEK